MSSELLLQKIKPITSKKEEESKKQILNIFKLLEVENAEDKTHSAFIGNLLDPLGKSTTPCLQFFLQYRANHKAYFIHTYRYIYIY